MVPTPLRDETHVPGWSSPLTFRLAPSILRLRSEMVGIARGLL